ncbi:MAG TPA: phosphopantetheine-binding protein [Bacteroidales bacterium]|nr:phosphopantetheine-binding protein [Bacteroidales bacterium]
MDKNEIRIRVKRVIAQVLERDPGEIADEADFVFDLGASSMQSIQLIAAFDEEFNIEMDQDKAMEVQNVSAAADFISSYLA